MSASMRVDTQGGASIYPPAPAESSSRSRAPPNISAEEVAYFQVTAGSGLHVSQLVDRNVVEAIIYPEGGYGWVVTGGTAK